MPDHYVVARLQDVKRYDGSVAGLVTSNCARCTFATVLRCWKMENVYVLAGNHRGLLCELQPSFLRCLSLPLLFCPRLPRSGSRPLRHNRPFPPMTVAVMRKTRAMAFECCGGLRSSCRPLS